MQLFVLHSQSYTPQLLRIFSTVLIWNHYDTGFRAQSTQPINTANQINQQTNHLQ